MGSDEVDPAQPQWPERDNFVLSKGHAGPALYSALALKGYFPREDLATLNENGTHFPAILTACSLVASMRQPAR